MEMKLIFTVASFISDKQRLFHRCVSYSATHIFVINALIARSFSFLCLPLKFVWYIKHYILSWVSYLPVSRVYQDVVVGRPFPLSTQTHQTPKPKRLFSLAVSILCVHLLLCHMQRV